MSKKPPLQNQRFKWWEHVTYPFWKIKEYDSSAEVEKAVQSGEADCFVVKAGQSLKTLANSKMRSIFLTKSGTSCFAVTRENITLMNILNKTIQTLPDSRLSSQFCVYENAPGKVTLAEYIKDNLRAVSIWFVSVVLIIVWIIVYLLIQARKAQIQAEKANAAKSDFLFNMSHDIRTPMNALLGYSELIKRELTDPKLLDYQEKMEQSGNLLLSIINNVLDMARIESGKVELDEDYVKIRDIYQGIYKIFQAEAEKKGIHLKMEYDVKHEHVICDETKNREIFLNLISNAVKYTASGGRVTIRITELDCHRKDYVRIRTQVIDTGIGMSEEFLPSLFEAFARERNTTDGKIAGTGLGMPIIKKYIDMMYGTIEVESKQGEGSKFTVTLEYRIADKSYYEQDTEKSSDVDETDRISGKHILLAEDNDLNAEIAQFILEDMGLMVDRVEDGVQCVSRIEQKPAGTYDLILMDIQMPNMDGYKATEVIRDLADKSKANIPIIAMTANAFEEVGFYSGARKLLEVLCQDSADLRVQRKNGSEKSEEERDSSAQNNTEIEIQCGISSVVYFMSQIGLSWDDAKIVSAHGRGCNLISHICYAEKVFSILGTSDGVAVLAEKLVKYGMGDVLLYVGENLSYENEKIFAKPASELTEYKGDPLSVICAVNENAGTRLETHGIRDEEFIRGKAPMTKEEVRTVSLSKLRLTADSVCYDVGAGTGSLSIEMALRAHQGQVWAIEKKEDAVELIHRNKVKFAADNLEIVEGLAPEALKDLPTPTHAFIGGSSGNLKEIVKLLVEKNPQVRIVINCITLETVSEALETAKEFGFEENEIVQLSAARSKAIGRYHMMMGENPIYIITLQNPGK